MKPLLIPHAVLADKRLGNSAARLLLCQMMRDGLTPKTLDHEATADFYDVSTQTVRNWIKQIKSLPGYELTGKPDPRYQCEQEILKPSVSIAGIKPVVPRWANDETTAAMVEFYEHRKKIKKPVTTQRSAVRLSNALEQLTRGDNAKAIQIINQSIDSGKWCGLYPLKERAENSWDF